MRYRSGLTAANAGKWVLGSNRTQNRRSLLPKIYGNDSARKPTFAARPLDTRIDIGKSMVCTGTVAEDFWPFCVDRCHGGSHSRLFSAV
jgi:hypothetical protein